MNRCGAPARLNLTERGCAASGTCQCSLSSHLGDELGLTVAITPSTRTPKSSGMTVPSLDRVMLGAKASGARFLRNRSSRLASSPCREKFVFSCLFSGRKPAIPSYVPHGQCLKSEIGSFHARPQAADFH
jgi:hypothetical protein